MEIWKHFTGGESFHKVDILILCLQYIPCSSNNFEMHIILISQLFIKTSLTQNYKYIRSDSLHIAYLPWTCSDCWQFGWIFTFIEIEQVQHTSEPSHSIWSQYSNDSCFQDTHILKYMVSSSFTSFLQLLGSEPRSKC